MNTGQPDSLPAVVAGILLCIVGAAHYLMMPLLIGSAAEQLKLVESQLGILASLLMSGATISALLAIFLVRRFHWKKLAAFTLSMMVIGTGGTLMTQDSFSHFLAAVFLISVGGGATYSLSLTILSDNGQPDRVFGYCIAAQVSFQVLGLLILPVFIENHGLNALLLFLLVLDISGLYVIRFLPSAGKSPILHNPFSVFMQGRVVYALLGCMFFFFNVGCFWAFIERMGNAFGFSAQTIGNSLAIGVSMGIVGSLAASWQGNRRGRLEPMMISAIGTVVSVILLSVSIKLAVYILALAIYNFVWNYSLAYQYSVVASVDASGRGIAVAPAFHALGATIGPAVAGLVITSDNFLPLNILVALSVIISVLLFIPALQKVKYA